MGRVNDKIFDEQLFKQYDIPPRKKIKEILGNFISDNPDPYKQDFVINSQECKYQFIEFQVCVNWKDDYPYDFLYIYERKRKYGDDTLFLTLNKNFTKGYLFDTSKINNFRNLDKYPNVWVYTIPLNDATFINLLLLDKHIIENL